MAEPGVIAARPLLLQALTVLNTTRRTLDPPGASEADLDRHAADVDQAARSLASLARDDTCPPKLEVALFDWRDRLGSHVLAARALGDMDVHPDAAMQLLRRGLDEAIANALFAELRARVATVD
jgi:hypothetical protein